MMIHVTPKRLKKIVVEATFENKGIAYSERFESKKKFSSYLGRTKDVFKNAVDYERMEVIRPDNVRSYLHP